MKVALIDTGHANLRSVHRALEEAGKGLSVTIERTHQPERIRAADKLVVPGQGGFGDCLKGLHQGGGHDAILEQARRGTPYLGICLGLQALFDGSEESPETPGLGLFPGRCAELRPAPGIKIPHMGWNRLEVAHGGHPVLNDSGASGRWFYFVHSFHALPTDPTLVKGCVQHGPQTVTAAVARDNVLATQFHPEKSQRAGLALLQAFLAW
jgi:glutamine amidotransferase